MSESYLIAHLVRGEPAFDIAIKLQIGDEEGWIIPTSGHRAYPYWSSPMWGEDALMSGLYCTSTQADFNDVVVPPIGHPDHYPLAAAPRGTGLITNLAERLGFVPKPVVITRR